MLVSVFVLQLFFFGFVALHRFVDGDEGYYLLGSRLVLTHQKLYVDFWFPQGPLLPILYAAWIKLAGATWTSARLFAAGLTAILGTLVTEDVYHHRRSRLAGFVAAVLFASSTLAFAWFPIAKTYSIAALFLFAGYMVISRMRPASRPWLAFAGGLLFGLSVDTRSYLLLLTPLFVLWIFRGCNPGARKRRVLWFLAGLMAGNLPAVYLFLLSPNAFMFNNIGCEAVRSDWGLIGQWEQKIVLLAQLFLSGEGDTNAIQNGILFFTSLGFLSLLPKASAPRFAFQIAASIGLISLLPTPTQGQYFCFCVPFLLVSALCGATECVRGLGSPGVRKAVATGCIALIACYVAVAARDFRRFLITGENVLGLEPGRENAFRLREVVAVSQAVDQVTSPGDAVASFWPGYLFQSHAKPFPGFENDFGLLLAHRITAEQRARYHILSRDDIETDFASQLPAVVVLRDHIDRPTPNPFRRWVRGMEDGFRAVLVGSGYERVRTVGDISIYAHLPQR